MAGRKKLNRTNLHARVAPGTPDKLREIAENMGYKYSDDGSIGQLFDAIASGELIVLPNEFKVKLVDTYRSIEYNIKCREESQPTLSDDN